MRSNDTRNDLEVIEAILQYCREIEEAHTVFGKSYEQFLQSSTYRNAVCMCLMQIGELAHKLSLPFQEEHPEIPWRSVYGMRNVVAHGYGGINFEVVWNTATARISELQVFCESLLT